MISKIKEIKKKEIPSVEPLLVSSKIFLVGIGEPVFLENYRQNWQKSHLDAEYQFLQKLFEVYGNGFWWSNHDWKEHNDLFNEPLKRFYYETNLSGGIQGGIFQRNGHLFPCCLLNRLLRFLDLKKV